MIMKLRQIIPLISVVVIAALVGLIVNFYSEPINQPIPEPSISIAVVPDHGSQAPSPESSPSIIGHDESSQLEASSSEFQALNASLQSADNASSTPDPDSVQITAPNGIIQATIATSSAAQNQGLGDRDSLPLSQGMIFVFSKKGSYGFWMRDMRFALDIVWIGADKKVIGVSPHVSPLSYPDLLLPPSPVLYVLEINAGQAKRYGIIVGTKLDFNY